MIHFTSHSFPLAGRAVTVFRPGGSGPLPVVLALAGEDLPRTFSQIAPLLAPALESGACRPFQLACFSPLDWNRALSPWPAPALGPKSAPFAGEGAATLDFLQNQLLPELGRRVPVLPGPENTHLLGYSLGGLLALWSLYQTDAFGGAASCSGSLWFDGFLDWAGRRHPQTPSGCRVYLSLGRREEKARDPRMAQVGDATRSFYARLQAEPLVQSVTLDWQEGGHFTAIPQRLAKALLWLEQADPAQ